MDVTRMSSATIMENVRNIFHGGNDANLQVSGGSIFHVMRVAHYFKMHGHAVEWRHDAVTYVWICKRRSRVRVVIATAPQVEQVKTMILRHRLLEVELEATGEMPIQWAHAVACWACNHGFVSQHDTFTNGYRILLRKPHDALPAMDLDD